MVSPFPAQWTPDHAAAVEPRAGSPAHIPKLGAAELDHGEVGARAAGIGGLKVRSARRVFLYSGHGLRLPAFLKETLDVSPQPNRAARGQPPSLGQTSFLHPTPKRRDRDTKKLRRIMGTHRACTIGSNESVRHKKTSK